ncbi:ETS homologous factor-like [Uloborus diversus]|uniref:ETS homologous factor-like n=1 Tax=Uloborus diversus TaxID=327109 RepID=UPI0024095680|nr:ETS homologous factor-like [Uloborus diversus]
MYSSGVLPSSPTGGCYYYYPDGNTNNNSNNAHHQHGIAHHQNHQQPEGGAVGRTYYQSHGTAPLQQRTMNTDDLGPDLQFIGNDVPFYEIDAGKKEMHYADLQPLHSQEAHQISNAAMFDLITFPTNNTDISDPWEATRPYLLKHPSEWNTDEVLDWMLSWSRQTGVDLLDVNMRELNGRNGQNLCSLTEGDFYQIDNAYGPSLWQSLQNEIANHYQLNPILNISNSNTQLPGFNMLSNNTYLPLMVGSEIQGSSPYSSHDSDREDRESTSSSMSTANEKSALSSVNTYITSSLCAEILDDKKPGRRGRPPKTEARSSRSRQGKGNGKLWEFIRDLLLDPATNPSLIRWERLDEGIFKFVQSDRVAKMWGDRKQNPRMTYEKLSRAMRTYYSSGILSPVPKTEGLPKKLIYKFGPKANGWSRDSQLSFR